MVPPRRGFAIHHSTVTRSRIARNLLSLKPRTIIRCSARRKGPYCARCARIRSASTLPTPGSASRSRAEAVFMLSRRKSRMALLEIEFATESVEIARCDSLTHEQASNESPMTIDELRRNKAKQAGRSFLSLNSALVVILLVGNSVSRMQTNVCEEFRSTPL